MSFTIINNNMFDNILSVTAGAFFSLLGFFSIPIEAITQSQFGHVLSMCNIWLTSAQESELAFKVIVACFVGFTGALSGYLAKRIGEGLYYHLWTKKRERKYDKRKTNSGKPNKGSKA